MKLHDYITVYYDLGIDYSAKITFNYRFLCCVLSYWTCWGNASVTRNTSIFWASKPQHRPETFQSVRPRIRKILNPPPRSCPHWRVLKSFRFQKFAFPLFDPPHGNGFPKFSPWRAFSNKLRFHWKGCRGRTDGTNKCNDVFSALEWSGECWRLKSTLEWVTWPTQKNFGRSHLQCGRSNNPFDWWTIWFWNCGCFQLTEVDEYIWKSIGMSSPDSGGARNSPTQELRSLTGGLNARGHDYAPFVISLFEGRKHHVIFRKNSRNNWLETIYF